MAIIIVRDALFERAGITELVGEDAIYLEVDDAVAHYLAAPPDTGRGGAPSANDGGGGDAEDGP